MPIIKDSYLYSKKKRNLQTYLFSMSHKDRIIGLGGPNLNEYVCLLRDHKFKEIIIYENNRSVFLKQLSLLPQVSIRFGDVLNHLEENAFYDLDFCCSIKKIEDHLKEIDKIKQFCLTVSLRPVGLEKTLEIASQLTKVKYVTYGDTTPMITFYKGII